MEKPEIKRAEVRDFDKIYDLICILEETQFDRAAFFRLFTRNLEADSILYYTASTEGRIIGFASLYILNLLHHCGSIAELQEFIILKEFRGKGIGTAMILELEKAALNHGCSSFEVNTGKKRIRTHEFYKNFGMKNTHLRFTSPL